MLYLCASRRFAPNSRDFTKGIFVASYLKEIYIIGASGFGREVADTIHVINKETPTYKIVGFIDDDESKHGQTINDIQVLGGVSQLIKLTKNIEKPSAIIAIADPQIKEGIAGALDGIVRWANIIHPTAVVSEYSHMGEGVVLQPYVFIGPNTSLANHVHVNVTSVVGHDTIIGAFSSCMTLCAISGNVTLGKGVYVGSSAAIIPGVTVGQHAAIGAGAVVIKDVEDEETVVGNPARRI
jgi:sugar O-acyltransferase (sialic acid O-acetyltransferase NeuD family)